jgi:Rieske 2Fe-2S family protein
VTELVPEAAAPIDAGGVMAVLDEEYGRARTLPAQAYLSEDVLAWERRHMFDGAWVCIGRSDLAPAPREQRAIQLGSEGLLLVRGDDGVLRAFSNTCRHRGHELLPAGAAVNKQAIRCPYHSWVYALDGRLQAATRFSDVPGFDPGEFPLIGLEVAEMHGWVFLNMSGDAPPFTDWTGNLAEVLDPWEPGRLFVGATHEYVVKANWKTIVENYLECYHCPNIHPELCRVSPPESARGMENTGAWIGGPMDLEDFAETMSMTGKSTGVPIRGLSAEQRRRVFYMAVFPNLLISPHPDYVMAHRLEPVSPGETHVECSWLFPPESKDRPDFDASYASDFWDITNGEDFAACESVYRGVGMRGYRPGPFDYREAAVHAIQQVVARAYLTGEVTKPQAVDMTRR